jgi:Flp pilus assembly protein TadB
MDHTDCAQQHMTILWLVGIALAFFRVHRSRRRRNTAAIKTTQLSNATDMLSVLLLSGMTTPQALQQLHHYLDDPCRTVFHDSSQLLSHGSRFHDVVRQLSTTFGSPAFALCEALLASERDGIAVGPLLERLSAVTRQQRRQELDAAARQLPVRMAIPLVVCVLPSFVLLGVVPLFVGSLGGLGAHM